MNILATELNEKVKLAKLDLQYDTVKYGPITNFVVAIALTACLFDKIEFYKLTYWIIILGLADLLYWVVFLRYKSYKNKIKDISKWQGLYWSVIAASTIVWGSSGYLFMLSGDISIQFLIVCFLFAVCAGFVQGTFADVWSCRISVSFILLPLAVWCLKQNSLIYVVMDIIIIIYAAFLFFINYRGSRLLADSLKLQFQNEIFINRLGSINKFLEQKVSEQTKQLKEAKDEAEAANQAKTEFLNITTLELKTPFKIIKSYSEEVEIVYLRLLKGYKLAKGKVLPVPYITPQQFSLLPRLLTGIKNELEASANFINMLRGNLDRLNVSESSDLECSVKGCIQLVLERYPFNANERKLVKLREGKDFTFIGNQILIVHVIFNLLKNALQCIKEEHIGHIEIWLESAESKNYLHFKDTAKGIAPDVLPYIFNRYYTKSKGGTGLGLAFCQMIMKGIGGKITCDSKLHEYTEFVLEFPNI